MARAIDALNFAVGKQTHAYDAVNNALTETNKRTRKVKESTEQVNNAVENTNKKVSRLRQLLETIVNKNKALNWVWTKSVSAVTKIKGGLSKWATVIKRAVNNNVHFNKTLQTTGKLASSVGAQLKSLAATYLGIMGTQAVLDTTDVITSAQNRLNYINYQQLGSAGANEDGSYSPAVFDATQETMDKMYVSAQKVRMSYGDMMSNVSKTMTLAGDAFQGNIDNAIRFQEIMAESYTLGGASAQEMSSSMYQLTQALGAGILAGDELRSVREGAPLAYQKIEEFAQGVYNTTDSLKDMASEGMITSEMVVAAIMNMGDEADKAFAQTDILFSQAFQQIKNAATKAFEPVFDIFRNTMNKCIKSGLIAKLEDLFFDLSKGIQIAIEGLSRAITWLSDNWATVQTVVISGLLTIGVLLTAIAIKTAVSTLTSHAKFIGVALAIFAVVWALYAFYKGLINVSDAITVIATVAAVAFLIIGIAMKSAFLVGVAGVIALATLIFIYFDKVCGWANVAWTFIVNLVQDFLNIVFGVVAVIAAIIKNVILFIVNLVIALLNVCKTVGKNIGIAFENAWIFAQNTFWSFIKSTLIGLQNLIRPINKILEAMDKDPIDLSGTITEVENKTQKYKEFHDVSAAWNDGLHTYKYDDIGDAWNKGHSAFGTGFSDWSASDEYNKGAKFGRAQKAKLNRWGADLQNKMEGKFGELSFDSIGKKFGLDFGEMLGTDVPDVSGAYTMPDDLSKIADDTGKISDSLDLRDDDLDYLRKIAEMEWRKEYTTASIKVDMSNYNTINDDRDLDGIVKYLSDTLNEEMASLAYGVHY